MDFRQDVAQAQQHIADALRAAAQPSAFSQGVQPLAPQQELQAAQPGLGVMQQPMGQPMLGQPMPGQPAMPQPMAQPTTPQMPAQQPPAQFAKGGLAVKKFWDKPAPEGAKPKKLSAKSKASAKRRAKAAGRPWPNLVDNAFAARRKK